MGHHALRPVGRCGYLIVFPRERREPHSQSALWTLQRRYFTERGIAAWSRSVVPFYVTSNPRIAAAYTEIVLAFLRDQDAVAPSVEPLYVIELGAGSGRFAFHFLTLLVQSCEQSGIAPSSFRYVLTDISENTLAFWRDHPRFQPFFERGVLDVAAFDVESGETLELRVAGRTIAPGTLDRAPCIIANYVFDSVVQDFFRISGGRVERCLISPAGNPTLDRNDPGDLLEQIEFGYACEPLDGVPYAEPYLAELLNEYREALAASYVSVPATALRCLERMRALSSRGALVLCADKGSAAFPEDGSPAPRIVHHGSVSINVNFHALARTCDRHGGVALFPDRPHTSICVGALVMTAGAGTYRETQRAYDRHVRDFGPDDYFSLTRTVRRQEGEHSVHELLACVRLGFDDDVVFARCVPRIVALAPQLDARERRAVAAAVERVWAMHFPVEERFDLAYELATVLYAIDDYAGALRFFERSVDGFGRYGGTLYNMALCCRMLGRDERAALILAGLVRDDPGNADAKTMLRALRDLTLPATPRR